MATFKKSKLFNKTFEKQDKLTKSKFADFAKFKGENPLQQFGKSDYAFRNNGHFAGLWHAKLTFDKSIVYKHEAGTIYLYGIFSHDDLGTGQPANISKQRSMGEKLRGQVFERRLLSK